jgi:phosphopantothenoylcysteine decarboxylase / phosphopantothenate---cysteine ligase
MKLKDKNIMLCVTGGIAAYKSVMLASFLKKQGANVHAVLTRNAARFVTPLTFKNITRNKVATRMFDDSDFVPHISLANLADLTIIAPATANIIAKIANGIADDLVSTLVLSMTTPIIIVPAMNTNMYLNPMTRENIKKLKDNGFFVMEPDVGLMACGTSGEGRFPEIERIYGFIMQNLPEKGSVFFNRKVVIATGGTAEDIDPVRCITNRSSGMMGFSFAEEFIKRGAKLTVVLGNVSELLFHNFSKRYPDIRTVRVRSAESMKNEILKLQGELDVLFMPAAVADYTPEYSGEKIKKGGDTLDLKLKKTADILSTISKKPDALYIGFTAESGDLERNARGKLEKKNLTFVVGNNITGDRSAMGGDKAQVILLNKWNTDIDEFEYAEKTVIAGDVLDRIEQLTAKNFPGFLK